MKTTTNELIKTAKELGYTIVHIVHDDSLFNNFGTQLYIIPTERDGYTPEIYRHERSFRDERTFWQVQTTSYGALEVEEISKVIKGLQNGQKMAELLNCIDLEKLEEYRIDR